MRAEPASAYRISLRETGSSTVIVAPHGGGIEPGTSDMCLGIAGEDLSWYQFEGRKAAGNGDLHITSSNFDEPRCLALIGSCRSAVTVHGEGCNSEAVYVGGLHLPTIGFLHSSLAEAGFDVREHANANLQGRHPRNICNLGTSGEGVQLEVSRGLRRSFFAGMSTAGRAQHTERFSRFCSAVRRAIDAAAVG